mgnify:CR=1 FL=1
MIKPIKVPKIGRGKILRGTMSERVLVIGVLGPPGFTKPSKS